jgi:hypothetical protein
MIYNILVKSHSGLRWMLLAAILVAIVRFASAATARKKVRNLGPYALTALILLHIQVLVGLWLYVISPKVIFAASAMKVGVQRFFLVEHISLMILAAVLMTIGYSTTKKQINTPYGGKKLLFYYLIALFLILLAIPWPFRGFGTAWF